MSNTQTTFSGVTRFRLLWFTVLLMAFMAVSAQPADAQSTSEGKTESMDASEIESVLARQTKAWNEGDLEKFMQTYWQSDDLTFCSGGKITRGWQSTLDNYKKGYPTKAKMGQLHFDGLEVSMIESNSALVLGKWHLRMADETKLNGNFTLVVKKFDSTWKIIHDHSSSLVPQAKTPDSEK